MESMKPVQTTTSKNKENSVFVSLPDVKFSIYFPTGEAADREFRLRVDTGKYKGTIFCVFDMDIKDNGILEFTYEVVHTPLSKEDFNEKAFKKIVKGLMEELLNIITRELQNNEELLDCEKKN